MFTATVFTFVPKKCDCVGATTAPTYQKPRRAAFLRACQNISNHYRREIADEDVTEPKTTPPELLSDSEYDSDFFTEEDERTDKRVTAAIKKEAARKEHLREGIDILKRLLHTMDDIPKSDRNARMRRAELIFKTVLEYDDILIDYQKIRDTVRTRIHAITRELDEMDEKLNTHVPRILQLTEDVAEQMNSIQSNLMETNHVKAYLNNIQSMVRGLKNTLDSSHLRAIMKKVLDHRVYKSA